MVSGLIALGAAGLVLAVLLRWVWPELKDGFAAATADEDELDDLVEEVGNVDRRPVPGESGVGGDNGPTSV